MRVLPKRLAKYGLRFNQEKTQQKRVWQASSLAGIQAGGTYPYLGFSRLHPLLEQESEWESPIETEDLKEKISPCSGVNQQLRGHFNYFGVSDNSLALYRFARAVHSLLFKWLNRRSQRRSFTWESFLRYQARYPLPKPGRLVSVNPTW